MKFADPSSSGLTARARQPRAAQIAELLKQRIKQGVYQPGEQLPSLREFRQELQVSFPTIQRAVQRLEGEGILEAQHGVGIKVCENADVRNTALLFGFVQPYFSRFSLALQGYLEDALDNHCNLCVVKSSHNNSERERREIERLLANGVNGLLIWPVDSDDNGAFLQKIAKDHPLVLIDRTLEGVQALSVILDYEQAARNIMRHLHRLKRRRILVIWDPVNISSYNQLKVGLREESVILGMTGALDFWEFPVIRLIESTYQTEYELADQCYAQLEELLRHHHYDAVFCPQSEFFDQVFADAGRVQILSGIHLLTMRTPDGPPHSRRYFEMNIDEWVIDTSRMLVTALNLLQDMTLQRRNWRRVVKIPIARDEEEEVLTADKFAVADL